MLDKVKEVITEVDAFEAKNLQEIEAFRIKYLGQKGVLKHYFAEFKNIPNEQKKEFGQAISTLKSRAQEKVEKLKQTLDTAEETLKYGRFFCKPFTHIEREHPLDSTDTVPYATL